MKTSTISVAPVNQAVSLKDAKRQLRIDESDATYDSEIARLVKSATQWIERRYGLSLITQTRIQKQDQLYERYPIYRNFLGPYYSRFPVTLLFPPVQSITAFNYYDTNQVLQAFIENVDFYCSGKMTPTPGAQDIEIPRMWPNSAWPVFKWIPDAIQVAYISGFGIDHTYVPETIKTAVLMLVANFFENRMEEITGERIAKFEMSIDRVMSSYEIFDHVGIYA